MPADTPEMARQSNFRARFGAELEAIETGWLDAGLPLPLNTYKRVKANCVMPLAHRIGTDPAILDIVEGIETNIPFHRAILEDETFLSGGFDTNLLDRKGAAAFLAAIEPDPGA